jgi:hypothetical protein
MIHATGEGPGQFTFQEEFGTEREAMNYIRRLWQGRAGAFLAHNAKRARFYKGRGGMWVVSVDYDRDSP